VYHVLSFATGGGVTTFAPRPDMVTFAYLPPMSTNQKSGLPNPVTSSPAFRRRRTVWFLLACIVCAFLFFSSSVPLHPLNLFGSSSTELNALHRDVLELHGLQHFVLNSDLSLHDVLYKANRDRPQGVPVRDHVRTADSGGADGALDPDHGRLDPAKDVDLKVYSSFDGDDDWVKHVRELENASPLVVFSKSYCPYSRRAKSLLQTYSLDPAPRVIEVDLREDGDLLKVILTRLTKHSTFPNIILRGHPLGGSDDLQALHDAGKLEELFEENGLAVHGSR